MRKLSTFIVFYLLLPVVVYSSSTITTYQVNNLAAFCKVWGTLKYFHPKVQKMEIDWDSVMIKNAEKVINARNKSELNAVFRDLIFIAGPVKKLKKPYQYLPKDTSLNNLDFQWMADTSVIFPDIQKSLMEVVENYKPRSNKYIETEMESAYKKSERIYRKYEYFQDGTCSPKLGYPDLPHSLLAVFRYWNVINYYYPYKKSGPENWNNVLEEIIAKVYEDVGRPEYYADIDELTNKIHDSHSSFECPMYVHSFIGDLRLPIFAHQINDKTVLCDVDTFFGRDFGLNNGDVLLKINDTDINVFRKRLRSHCFGSTNAITERNINIYLFIVRLGENYTYTLLDSNNKEKTIDIKLERATYSKYFDYYKPKKTLTRSSMWKILPSGYGYIDLENFESKDFRKAFHDLRHTKALMLDIRNYPMINGYEFGKRFLNRNAPFCKFYGNNHKYPGTFSPFLIKPDPIFFRFFLKKYHGKVVVLVDENTQSAAEFSTMAMQANADAKVIGRNTSGADGNVEHFMIQDDIGTIFTGNAVFYPDGRPTQRIGIMPDLYVNETIKGIRNGRDEILDKAIEYLKAMGN